MMDVEIEPLVDALSRGIVALQHPHQGQAEAVERLRRLVAVGEEVLAPIADWNGVPALQVPRLSQVEMGKVVLHQGESLR
jgi:hypothetical protein